MKNRRTESLNAAASVVRCTVLLTATIMTRVHGAPGAPDAGLDLFLALGGLYALVTAFAERYPPRYRPDPSALVPLDVLYITGLIWRTGGLHSEFYLLYYLPILNASMRLDFRQAVLSSALAGLCYALIAVVAGVESTVTTSALVQLATFGGSALVLALFFATMATLSNSQRELTEKLQHAVERLSALYRVARAVHARDSLQSVVDTTVELAVELSRAEVGYLALSNNGGELLVKSSLITPEQSESSKQPGFDRHLAEHSLVRRAPVVTDARGDYPELARPAPGCCVMSVPLLRGEDAIGALQLLGRPGDTFDQHAQDVVTALAQEAAVAIENARLLTEVQRLSVSDELTGLYHRSEFRRLLASEVETARSNGDPVAVVLFDVDGMRQINAEHGHAAGDAVLLAFADLLRRYVRAQDIAARYGADEFAVLIPRGGIDAARAVSSRLCHAMAHHEFQFEGERGAPPAGGVHHFTVCAGAVVTHEMPSSADQLIGRADEALFEARHAGPGQIRFWEATGHRGIVTQVRQIVEHAQHLTDEQWR